MKVVQYEKDTIKFDDYPEGVGIYFFYTQKKIDGQLCWVHDEDKLLLDEALRKYPKNRYQWQEIKDDL